MTKLHVMVIGLAALLAGVALFSPHAMEGLSLAAAILTGVFGHAQGSGQLIARRPTPPDGTALPPPPPGTASPR